MSILRLVSDEYGRVVMFGQIRIVASPDNCPPFSVDAAAFEEDTNLLMSGRAEIQPPRESYGELVTDMAAFEPVALGSVVVQAGSPMRLLVVIHDIEKTPTWRESVIREALGALLAKSESMKFEALSVPVLGGVHGNLQASRFAGLFKAALEEHPPQRLQRVWIQVKDKDTDEVLNEFR